MKPVVFLSPAVDELLGGFKYYENEALHLGYDFLNKVKTAVDDILKYPESWPIVRSSIRRRLVHRFPYAILYRIDPDEIVLVAVMHLHRHPDYWTERIE